MNENANKLAWLMLIGVAALLVLGGLIWFIYKLAQLITLPIALLVCLVLTWLSFRELLRIALFPGSCSLWRRSIEAHYCKEMALQLFTRLCDIELSLRLILEKCSDFEKREFLAKPVDCCLNSKLLVLTLIENYTLLREDQPLTASQSAMVEMLMELQQVLAQVTLVLPNSAIVSYWRWLESIQSETEWLEVILEDFPHNTAALHALQFCESLLERLTTSFSEVPLFAAVRRWLLDSSFGSIDLMRVEMRIRFDYEQVWVNGVDGKRIDCVWIPHALNTCPAVLLLNPNAGLIEFAYYQNDWVEVYRAKGFHIMLMNYRGYGRSEGVPTPELLKKDVESVFEYISQVKEVKAIAVHGESLGGMLAAHLGRTKPVSLLIADRSFSSFSEVALHNFGLSAQWFFKLFGFKWDSDCALDYVYTSCYKVIATDPLDTIIKDMGSLKNGVAIKLLETQGLQHYDGVAPAKINLEKYVHLFPAQKFQMFYESVVRIMNYVMSYERNDDVHGHFSRDFTSTGNYFPIAKDMNPLDEEAVNNLLGQLMNLMESLDAGGKPLNTIYTEKASKAALKVWVIVLDTWGSFYGLQPGEDPKENSKEKLKAAIDHLGGLAETQNYSTNPLVIELTLHLKNLQECLKFLLAEFMNVEGEFFTSRSMRVARSGWLIPLTCGHNGVYSMNEKAQLDWHIESSGILQYINAS